MDERHKQGQQELFRNSMNVHNSSKLRKVRDFFEAIESQPNDSHTCTLSQYTVSVTYTPISQGPWVSSCGLAMESAKSLKQHAVYLKLKKKASQVSLAEPMIVA